MDLRDTEVRVGQFVYLNLIFYFGVFMKNYICNCSVCASARRMKFTEYDMHSFVGRNAPNHKVSLLNFELGLKFGSVTHWNVGFVVDSARYYMYRDDNSNVIAWYDNMTMHGYK